MKKIDVSKLDNKISEIVKNSQYISDKKKAIDITVQVAFNMLAPTYEIRRPFGFMKNKFQETDLIHETDIASFLKSGMELIKLFQDAEPFSDVLHDVYATFLSFEKGQHMTPPDVADLMFELQKENFEGKLNQDNPFSIGDMSGCGLGSSLLGQLRGVYRSFGKEGVKSLDLTGVDIDYSMCMATIFQIEASSIIFDIPYNQLGVYHANALTTENHAEKLVYLAIPNQFSHKKFIPKRELQEA